MPKRKFVPRKLSEIPSKTKKKVEREGIVVRNPTMKEFNRVMKKTQHKIWKERREKLISELIAGTIVEGRINSTHGLPIKPKKIADRQSWEDFFERENKVLSHLENILIDIDKNDELNKTQKGHFRKKIRTLITQKQKRRTSLRKFLRINWEKIKGENSKASFAKSFFEHVFKFKPGKYDNCILRITPIGFHFIVEDETWELIQHELGLKTKSAPAYGASGLYFGLGTKQAQKIRSEFRGIISIGTMPTDYEIKALIKIREKEEIKMDKGQGNKPAAKWANLSEEEKERHTVFTYLKETMRHEAQHQYFEMIHKPAEQAYWSGYQDKFHSKIERYFRDELAAHFQMRLFDWKNAYKKSIRLLRQEEKKYAQLISKKKLKKNEKEQAIELMNKHFRILRQNIKNAVKALSRVEKRDMKTRTTISNLIRITDLNHLPRRMEAFLIKEKGLKKKRRIKSGLRDML